MGGDAAQSPRLGDGQADNLLTGLDAWRHRWRGRRQRKGWRLAPWQTRAERISHRAEELEALTPEAFAVAVTDMRSALQRTRRVRTEDIDEALSLAAAAMQRTTGRRPYSVQLVGALVMQDGWLIEMATGEGKTLTAGLCAAVWAWRWRQCQVVTANDYLAARDAAELTEFYALLGLDCAAVVGEMPGEERQRNYRCAVTYTTGQQILADHLRDALAFPYAAGSNRERITQLVDPGAVEKRLLPPRRAAIIDEADSVLADDAVTPMIIARAESDEELRNAVQRAFALSGELRREEHYSIREGSRAVVLHDAAQERWRQRQAEFPPTWRADYRIAFLVTKCLVARHLHHRDQHYVVVDGKVVIIDEKTGRMLPQTTWSDGLHQAVEAKEGLELTDPTKASVRMTCQSFFRGYPRLTGMSGTLTDIADEFWRIYELPMARIPTRLPRRHRVLPDRLFDSASAQQAAVVEDVRQRRAAGQPVLVGTRSVRDSRALGAALSAADVPHVVLNALEHEREAEIVSLAGESGRVTVATNMAGRGTDIKIDAAAERAGGLHVIGTERHDSRRVDQQLIGRSSRQGEPGSSRFILSLEDALLREFIPETWRLRVGSLMKFDGVRGMLLKVYRWRQWRAERAASSLRVRMLQHEQQMKKSMSFARWQ